MAKVTIPVAYQVEYTEHERGWGSNLIDVEYYSNEEEAISVARAYNEKHNTDIVAPDYYILARYVGRVG